MPDFLQQMSDAELLLLFQTRSNKQAIGELFKRHSLMCFAVCNKYLKNEDASQDAVMQIFENLFTDLQKHEISNFRSWLHSVARNHCLMILRKPELLLHISSSEEESENSFMEKLLPLHQESETHDLENKLQHLEVAMNSLQEKQRLCIELFYFQKLSYEAIGEKTGLTQNEIKSAIQNGKRNLKINLAEKGVTYMLVWIIWIQQSA
jgi:RNA polymerase sigma-70 factor (ECF subfamily)